MNEYRVDCIQREHWQTWNVSQLTQIAGVVNVYYICDYDSMDVYHLYEVFRALYFDMKQVDDVGYKANGYNEIAKTLAIY